MLIRVIGSHYVINTWYSWRWKGKKTRCLMFLKETFTGCGAPSGDVGRGVLTGERHREALTKRFTTRDCWLAPAGHGVADRCSPLVLRCEYKNIYFPAVYLKQSSGARMYWAQCRADSVYGGWEHYSSALSQATGLLTARHLFYKIYWRNKCRKSTISSSGWLNILWVIKNQKEKNHLRTPYIYLSVLTFEVENT
jgi:hypothetical protein